MPIYLTAVIKSKAAHQEVVRATLLNMVTESRKEPACLRYDLYQDDNNPNVFVFQEIWESREGLDARGIAGKAGNGSADLSNATA